MFVAEQQETSAAVVRVVFMYLSRLGWGPFCSVDVVVVMLFAQCFLIMDTPCTVQKLELF